MTWLSCNKLANKPVAIAILALSLAHASHAQQDVIERSAKTEVYARSPRGVYVSRAFVRIPRQCDYLSHDVERLSRVPDSPPDETWPTWFADQVWPDSKVVLLHLYAARTGSSLRMRLNVRMTCRRTGEAASAQS